MERKSWLKIFLCGRCIDLALYGSKYVLTLLYVFPIKYNEGFRILGNIQIDLTNLYVVRSSQVFTMMHKHFTLDYNEVSWKWRSAALSHSRSGHTGQVVSYSICGTKTRGTNYTTLALTWRASCGQLPATRRTRFRLPSYTLSPEKSFQNGDKHRRCVAVCQGSIISNGTSLEFA